MPIHRQIHNASLRPDPKRMRRGMVRNQLEARGIRNHLVLGAMAQVPRHLFVQEALAPHAYDDAALPIGYGQTISQPFMVARMSELLMPEPGMRILEIGAGCGYQAAVLAAMGCIVHAVERVRPIYQATLSRLRLLRIRNIQLHYGDGTLGIPHAAPFDRIIVSAGGPAIPPPLIAQLEESGVMLIPVGPISRCQRLIRLRKQGMKIQTEDMGPAIFVDLVGDHGWKSQAAVR